MRGTGDHMDVKSTTSDHRSLHLRAACRESFWGQIARILYICAGCQIWSGRVPGRRQRLPRRDNEREPRKHLALPAASKARSEPMVAFERCDVSVQDDLSNPEYTN
eukprot:scaffold132760_cov31-Tisochrysis_lutea.AAC.2